MSNAALNRTTNNFFTMHLLEKVALREIEWVIVEHFRGRAACM
jgi:hypothetical protein